jgi:hypothetical protein
MFQVFTLVEIEDPATGELEAHVEGVILLRAWTGAVLIRVK